MTIAIIGATGQLGGTAVDALLARGTDPAQILALGRNEERLAALAERGLRTATVDLGDADATAALLDGAESLVLISFGRPGGGIEERSTAIEAAGRAGVQHLVYTSATRASDTTLLVAPEHAATEERIASSGVPATVLRNGWYTENHRQDFETARRDGVIANSAGDGRIASAVRREYGEAIAAVLGEPGHEGRTYELSGDTAWSFADFAAAAQEVLGTPVRYEALDPEEQRRRLAAAGLDAGTADFVVAIDRNVADGTLDLTTGDLARLIGHPTEPLVDTLRTWR